MFKILSTLYLLKKNIKYNIWRIAVRPSYIQDARFLKVNLIFSIEMYDTVETYRVSGTYCNSVNTLLCDGK